MATCRVVGVALVLVGLCALLPSGLLAQGGMDTPHCSLEQLVSLEVALDSSTAALMANPGDSVTEEAVQVAMTAFQETMAICLPPAQAADTDLSPDATGAAIEAACPTETVILYVDDSATGSNNGSTWTDAYRDLQTALAAAAETCA